MKFIWFEGTSEELAQAVNQLAQNGNGGQLEPRECKNPECKKIFIPTSKRQLFCEPRCGNLYHTKKWQAKQKKEKAKTP